MHFTHSKNLILLTLLIITSGCSVTVYDEPGHIKRIEQRGSTVWSTSPQAAYAHKDTQTGLKILSLKECPNGYKLLEERYVPKTKEKKDMLIWRILCLQPE